MVFGFVVQGFFKSARVKCLSMVTDDQLQDTLVKYMEGGRIDADLAKHFYNQNDGFMVVQNDKNSGMGFIPKKNRLLVDVIEVGDDGKAEIRERFSSAFRMPTDAALSFVSQVRKGAKPKFSSGTGFDTDHDGMYK